MKLIDLLVRELHKRGGWPEGFVMAWQSEHDCEVYFCKPDNSTTIAARGLYAGLLNEAADCRGINGSVTRDQYQSALAASQKAEWSGAGLPPVGCECEWQDKNTKQWQPVKVVYASEWVTVIREINKEKGDDLVEIAIENYGDDARLKFRPIRSEADKKRDAAVEAIDYWMPEFIPDTPNEYYHAKKIYDAIAAGKIPGVKLED